MTIFTTKCQGFPGAGFNPNTLTVFSGKDMKEQKTCKLKMYLGVNYK